MSRYRPLPCAGIGLGDSPVCAGCLRLSPGIGGRVLQIRPDVSGGACSDFITGRRPVSPVRVTAMPMLELELQAPEGGAE